MGIHTGTPYLTDEGYVEGSTRLLRDLGAERYAEVLSHHRP
jgi:hypothetical protein